MSRKNKADLSLILVTVGWGASFILAKAALGEMQVFNFLSLRFLMAFALALVIFIKPMLSISRETLKYGIGLGLLLFLGFSLQTYGLAHTSVSKSAFITGLSVVMVPLIQAMLDRQIPKTRIVVGSLTAVAGLALMTMTGSNAVFNIGDVLTLAGAVFFALHIIGVGEVNERKTVQAVPMAILQIGTVGILSLILAVSVETPTLPSSMNAWMNIIALALFCTAGAYIVQNVAQQYTTATRTALIYAMEPVFAGICGFLLLGEVMSITAIIGAFLILAGTLISELPVKTSVLMGKQRKLA